MTDQNGENEVLKSVDLDKVFADKGVVIEKSTPASNEAEVIAEPEVKLEGESVVKKDGPLKKIGDLKEPVDESEKESENKETPEAAAPKEEAASELANPDDVIIDVNGKEMTATEVFAKYEEATTKLEAIEGDEWLKKFVDYKLNGGDPLAYLQSQTRDWAKASDFDLLRDDFYASDKVAGLDDEAKEELFAREISDKYSASIDGTYEDEDSKLARVGKQLIRRDAEKLRAAQIEKQKNFSLPKAEEKQPVVAFDPAKERESILGNEEMKAFAANKLVRLADSDFAHEVENPEEIIGMMVDDRKFWALFKNKDGKPDWGKLTKAFAFAQNPSKYESDLLALGKNQGVESYLSQKKNVTRVREVSQDKAATDSTGVFNKTEFLKQMALQLKK